MESPIMDTLLYRIILFFLDLVLRVFGADSLVDGMTTAGLVSS